MEPYLASQTHILSTSHQSFYTEKDFQTKLIRQQKASYRRPLILSESSEVFQPTRMVILRPVVWGPDGLVDKETQGLRGIQLTDFNLKH